MVAIVEIIKAYEIFISHGLYFQALLNSNHVQEVVHNKLVVGQVWTEASTQSGVILELLNKKDCMSGHKEDASPSQTQVDIATTEGTKIQGVRSD